MSFILLTIILIHCNHCSQRRQPGGSCLRRWQCPTCHHRNFCSQLFQTLALHTLKWVAFTNNPNFTAQKQISVKILPCVRPGVPAPRPPRDATPSAALESVSPSGIAVASNPPDSPGDTLKRGKLISSYQWMMIETFGKSFAIICCVVTSDKMQWTMERLGLPCRLSDVVYFY